MENFLPLVPLFFLTALFYATAGFGGGSTYLALLVLFGFPFPEIPAIALLCNMAVTAGNLFRFEKEGFLSVKKILPFVVFSLPAAYLGGSLPIGKTLFLALLGLSLVAAGLRLLWRPADRLPRKNVQGGFAWGVGLPAGAVLGFLSGLTGIGGGIFLSPLLYFLRWGDGRQIAACASFFIFFNSLSGFLGQFQKGGVGVTGGALWLLLPAVILGGQIGSFLGCRRFSPAVLQRITAVLVLFVAGKIFWGFL